MPAPPRAAGRPGAAAAHSHAPSAQRSIADPHTRVIDHRRHRSPITVDGATVAESPSPRSHRGSQHEKKNLRHDRACRPDRRLLARAPHDRRAPRRRRQRRRRRTRWPADHARRGGREGPARRAARRAARARAGGLRCRAAAVERRIRQEARPHCALRRRGRRAACCALRRSAPTAHRGARRRPQPLGTIRLRRRTADQCLRHARRAHRPRRAPGARAGRLAARSRGPSRPRPMVWPPCSAPWRTPASPG